jgi:hypothetical protein
MLVSCITHTAHVVRTSHPKRTRQQSKNTHLPQQLHPQLLCGCRAPALPKDRLAVAAAGARVAAHVLHQPQQRHVHLAEHLRPTPGVFRMEQHTCMGMLSMRWRSAGSMHKSPAHTARCKPVAGRRSSQVPPHLASSSATSCGVDTMTAPDSGSRCPKPICASPVPVCAAQQDTRRHHVWQRGATAALRS